jgi:hypothetical protein
MAVGVGGGTTADDVGVELGDSGCGSSVLVAVAPLVGAVGVGGLGGGTSVGVGVGVGEDVGVGEGAGNVCSHNGRSELATNPRIWSLALSRLPVGRSPITWVRSEGRKSLTLSRVQSLGC